MKKITFIFFCVFTTSVNAQQNISIINKFNWATQLVQNPTMPEDGTFQWDYLKSIGVGVAYEKSITKNLSSQLMLNYVKKGFHETSQFAFVLVEGTDQERKLINAFHYMSLDAGGKYYFSNKKQIRTFTQVALRSNYLMKVKMGSLIWPQTLSEPYKDYSDFRKISFSYVIGAGVEVNKLINLVFETDKDFTKTIDKPQLSVRNWVWSLNIGININQLLKKN